MVTRRQFSATSWALRASSMLAACVPGDSGPRDEKAARDVWRDGKVERTDGTALRRELVRCATLAPSSHDTQCWKSAIEDKAITTAPDSSRRCPAVVPDDHQLFVSLGCAAEDLVQAALAHGLMGNRRFEAGAMFVDLAAEDAARLRAPTRSATPRGGLR